VTLCNNINNNWYCAFNLHENCAILGVVKKLGLFCLEIPTAEFCFKLKQELDKIDFENPMFY
jgi:hypothetical protein